MKSSSRREAQGGTVRIDGRKDLPPPSDLLGGGATELEAQLQERDAQLEQAQVPPALDLPQVVITPSLGSEDGSKVWRAV